MATQHPGLKAFPTEMVAAELLKRIKFIQCFSEYQVIRICTSLAANPSPSTKVLLIHSFNVTKSTKYFALLRCDWSWWTRSRVLFVIMQRKVAQEDANAGWNYGTIE